MKTIFLLHSYADEKARDIAAALRRKCESAEFELTSTSDMPHGASPNVIASIFENIKRASLLIAIFNEQSPNVLLELGYALGIAKTVILVADLHNNLPFDLSMIHAVDYRMPTEEIAIKLIRAIEKLQLDDRLEPTDLPKELDGMLRLRNEYPEKFEQIPYFAFEEAVRNAFKAQGYGVQGFNPTQDFGFDFRIIKGAEMALVLVKKSSSSAKVSIAAVQQLLGAIHAYDAPKALLICTSDFTDSARGFANRYATELRLWTVDDLVRFLEGKITI